MFLEPSLNLCVMCCNFPGLLFTIFCVTRAQGVYFAGPLPASSVSHPVIPTLAN